MRLNENLQIIGSKVTLVPYTNEHVPQYHEWMKCPDILELTGSEPLTLEEEYEMVKTWRESEDKLTFIVLDTLTCKMIGDTNFYFSTDDEEKRFGEAEIMVAEKKSRGKKYGWQAMNIMMDYVIKNFSDLSYVLAKIKIHNHPSICMFTKMGFEEVSRSVVFNEVTYRVEINKTYVNLVEEHSGEYTILPWKET